MYKLKGFIAIDSLTRNQAGSNSTVGELSTYSLTFVKDKGVYASDTHPDLTLHAFTSAYTSGGVTTVPSALAAQVFAQVSWIHTKQMHENASAQRSAFLTDYIAQFALTASGVDCGEMVNWEGGVWFPEWISWRALGLVSTDPATDNTLKVWLSDESFSRQYDEYTIKVVPPVSDIDSLFAGYTALKAQLGAQTLPALLSAVHAAKEGYPETIMSAVNFDYVDPANAAQRLQVSWTLLIYGKAGNVLDGIRKAVRDYVAATSTHSEAEWRAIMPDLYQSTEFLVYPRWHHYAVPARTLQAGVYSPIVALGAELTYLKRVLPSTYTDTHITAYARTVQCLYKSLPLLVIGGPSNKEGSLAFEGTYPDFIAVPTSDTLFSAMAQGTQQAALTLQRLVMTAEGAGNYTDVPSDFQRVVREGITYITAALGQVTLLVASKASTPQY